MVAFNDIQCASINSPTTKELQTQIDELLAINKELRETMIAMQTRLEFVEDALQCRPGGPVYGEAEEHFENSDAKAQT